MVAPAVLAEFVPASVDDAGRVCGVHVGAPPYAEPFLAQTLARFERRARLRLDPAAVAELLGPQVAPVLLIGHTGRSGSTLLCRLLDASGAIASYREPPGVLDALAREDDLADTAITEAVIAWLAEAAHAVGLGAAVKLASRDAVRVPTLRLPPGSSRVGLIRHPWDVAGRVLADPPGWLVDRVISESELPRVVWPRGSRSDEESVGAIVGAVWAESAVALCEPSVDVVVTYLDLVDDPAGTVAAVAGPRVAEALLEGPTMGEILGQHSKSSEPFRRGGPALSDRVADAVLRAAQPGLDAVAARGIDVQQDLW